MEELGQDNMRSERFEIVFDGKDGPGPARFE